MKYYHWTWKKHLVLRRLITCTLFSHLSEHSSPVITMYLHVPVATHKIYFPPFAEKFYLMCCTNKKLNIPISVSSPWSQSYNLSAKQHILQCIISLEQTHLHWNILSTISTSERKCDSLDIRISSNLTSQVSSLNLIWFSRKEHLPFDILIFIFTLFYVNKALFPFTLKVAQITIKSD